MITIADAFGCMLDREPGQAMVGHGMLYVVMRHGI